MPKRVSGSLRRFRKTRCSGGRSFTSCSNSSAVFCYSGHRRSFPPLPRMRTLADSATVRSVRDLRYRDLQLHWPVHPSCKVTATAHCMLSMYVCTIRYSQQHFDLMFVEARHQLPHRLFDWHRPNFSCPGNMLMAMLCDEASQHVKSRHPLIARRGAHLAGLLKMSKKGASVRGHYRTFDLSRHNASL